MLGEYKEGNLYLESKNVNTLLLQYRLLATSYPPYDLPGGFGTRTLLIAKFIEKNFSRNFFKNLPSPQFMQSANCHTGDIQIKRPKHYLSKNIIIGYNYINLT